MGRKPHILTSSLHVSLALLLSAAVSCSQSKLPAARTAAPGVSAITQGGSGGSAANSDADAPPKDAQWTIYCQAIGGVDHVERANMAKAQLLKATNLKDWYVVHQEGESVIYYGFYRSINDPKDAKETRRAQADHQRLKEIVDAQGNKVLTQCLFVEVNAPDPTAPPEWNLANVQGYWSLQIGAFKESPQRKQAAVEAVREARKAGIPAYYYHGETTSSVCVGAWTEDAVKRQSTAREYNDPSGDLLILPQPLATSEKFQIRSKETGNKVQAVAPRVEAQDPSLVAMMARFPNHAVNGAVMTKQVQDPETGQMQDVPAPSFLVVIPHRTDSILTNAAPPAAQLASPALINPTVGVTPGTGATGGGKLRSIGD
jgi:hypothetical protein